MALQVYTSNQGTRVVAATELHQALQLTDHHYATNVKRWLQEVYQFKDGIRKPEKLKDYGSRKLKDGNSLIKDYYLTLDLAKGIVLASKSKVKFKYAKWLSNLDDTEEHPELVSKDQVVHVLELTKAMSMLSYQQAAEKKHLKLYEQRNNGQSKNWWKYRAQLLGYSSERLRRRLIALGKETRGKTQLQMLLQLDPHETIRTAVIDHFMALGKSAAFARGLGDLAKAFAKELQLEIADDRQQATLFAANVNRELLQELKAVAG